MYILLYLNYVCDSVEAQDFAPGNLNESAPARERPSQHRPPEDDGKRGSFAMRGDAKGCAHNSPHCVNTTFSKLFLLIMYSYFTSAVGKEDATRS
jgi:hypothetical protein